MVTDVTTILYGKSGQRTVPFLTILILQVLLVFVTGKTGNTKPLKEQQSCLTQKRWFFLPHFKNINSFCRHWFGTWFIVFGLLNFSGYLWARICLSYHLRALSFPLQLWAVRAQLAVEQRAPGALRLGGLQTIHSLKWPQAEKSTVVVALMVCQELFEYFRRAILRQSLVSKRKRKHFYSNYYSRKQITFACTGLDTNPLDLVTTLTFVIFVSIPGKRRKIINNVYRKKNGH